MQPLCRAHALVVVAAVAVVFVVVEMVVLGAPLRLDAGFRLQAAVGGVHIEHSPGNES